jgi:hypothetical protein
MMMMMPENLDHDDMHVKKRTGIGARKKCNMCMNRRPLAASVKPIPAPTGHGR